MNYENYDIVIVGSGAAGSAALWNLSSIKGLKILCIEQGSKIKKK